MSVAAMSLSAETDAAVSASANANDSIDSGVEGDDKNADQKGTPPTPRREVTLALLRRRSEHNENLVSTLEELALHQEELEAIGPVLGRTCGKTLRILLLQNNVIDRMDPSDLRFFKRLEYLNLALNNIRCVEGLRRCECLNKLDLTLNFVDVEDLERSVDELSEVWSLRELYFMGNPCWFDDAGDGRSPAPTSPTSPIEPIEKDEAGKSKKRGWANCRPYVIARLPQLQILDGKEVLRSERIVATQRLPALITELRELVQNRSTEKAAAVNDASIDRTVRHGRASRDVPSNGDREGTEDDDDDDDDEPIGDDELTVHSPSVRARISREMAAQREAKEAKQRANQPRYRGESEFEQEQREAVERAREREASLEERGEVRQCNEGKWSFTLDETSVPGSVVLTVGVQRYLSTSLIDLDVHPTYVSVVIKSKLLRLVLPAEVKAEAAKAERSAATGKLVVTMPKVNPEENMISLRASERAGKREKSTGRGEGRCRRAGNGGDSSSSLRNGSGVRLASDMLREALAIVKPKSESGINVDGSNRRNESDMIYSPTEFSPDMRVVSSRAKKKQDSTAGDFDDDDDGPPAIY